MTDTAISGGAANEAGRRAAHNTISRAGAELIGKVLSLLLFAVLAHRVGPRALGAFVFAFAFLQLAFLPVDLGYDRWLIRHVARERAATSRTAVDVLAIKLATALPLIPIVIVLVNVLGYSAQARACVYALIVGVVCESFGRTIFAVFTAHERADMVAIAVLVQRVATAGLGLLALFAGYGVVAVAGAYSAGALLGLVAGCVLVFRTIPTQIVAPRRGGWGSLVRDSAPFGVQDVFTAALFRLDAFILSLLATQAAVGRYGAAFRAFEATVFISIALSGAFLAMYSYLGPDTVPTIRAVFQRSMKACLASLLPITVVFAVLAGPLTRVLFGSAVHAAPALRILSPCVVLLGVVTLAVSLYVSRRPPRPIVMVTALMAVLNALLNVALIPSLDDRGAAIAMTVTEVAYAVVAMVVVVRLLGGIDWVATGAGPVAAAIAMALVALPFHTSLVLGLALSVPVYLLVLIGIERATSPGDLAFARDLLRRTRGRQP